MSCVYTGVRQQQWAHSQEEQMKSEIFFLKLLGKQDQESIVRLYGADRIPPDSVKITWEKGCSSLQAYIKKGGEDFAFQNINPLDEQITKVLRCLQENQIIHSCLSLDKFGVFPGFKVKLLDLAGAFFAGSVQPNWRKYKLSQEELLHASPERRGSGMLLTELTDVWSAGVLLGRLCCNEVEELEGEDPDSLVGRIKAAVACRLGETSALFVKLSGLLEVSLEKRREFGNFCTRRIPLPEELEAQESCILRSSLTFLGEGEFGQVFAGQTTEGRKVVLKTCDGTDEREWLFLWREDGLLRYLAGSPGVIKRENFFLFSADNKKSPALLLEHMEEDLLKYLTNRSQNLSIEEVRGYAQQLTEALFAIHQLGVIHRDIKIENILKRGNELKIADFGLATLSEKAYFWETRGVGSIYYSSPEILLSLPHDFATDIWSLGVVLVELALRQIAFPMREQQDLVGLKKEAIAIQENRLGSSYPEELIALCSEANKKLYSEVRKGGEASCTIEQRLSLVFATVSKELLDSFQSLIREMLQFEKQKRITAEALLHHPFIAEETGGIKC